MGQYEQLLNTAMVFIGRHDIAFSIGFLLTTQGVVWWMLARAISRIDQIAPTPPAETLAVLEDVSEPKAAPALAARGNPILARLVTNLRDEFNDPECQSIDCVARWQRRLARHGVVPPRTAAECDALLASFGDHA